MVSTFAPLPYIALCQHFICGLASLYIFFINIKLLAKLYHHQKQPTASSITPTLVILMCTWILRAIVTLICTSYLIIFWRPIYAYDINWIFYLNSMEFILTLVMQIPPLMIAIERIIILVMKPSTYGKLFWFFIFGTISLELFFGAISAVVYFTNRVTDSAGNFDRCWVSMCSFSHSGAAFFTYGKLGISLVYLGIASACLVVLFKWNHKHKHSRYNVGKLIQSTIYVEFVFILFPNFVTALTRYVFGVELNAYLGNYVKTAILIDGLVISYLMSQAPIFKKKVQQVVAVTTVS